MSTVYKAYSMGLSMLNVENT
uniref:Uncharacterized protein n=1 Tax=Rhizophora mucronata TaxID=61149 RepID=A0A2P2PDU8_RHIMU